MNEDVEIPFPGEIDEQGDYWSADISVNGHPTLFKLDTGAGVSVQSDRTPTNKAQRTWQNITSSDRNPESNSALLQNQSTSLLSKAACVSLNIFSRVDEISKGTPVENLTSKLSS